MNGQNQCKGINGRLKYEVNFATVGPILNF